MEPIGATLFKLFRQSSDHGIWVVACLKGAWTSIVGEQIAKVCRPMEWKDYCLTIEFDDDAWAATLQEMKGELRDRVRAATAGEVRELRFHVPKASQSPNFRN